MKKTTFLLIAMFSVTSMFAQKTAHKKVKAAKTTVTATTTTTTATESTPSSDKAPLEFKETKFSFGKIEQNKPVTHIFSFKNISGKPVVIESAVAGCGCTTPEYPKNAIAKGATNSIKVTYNAASAGAFTKQVTVKVANAKDPIVLNIDGEVVPAEAKKASK